MPARQSMTKVSRRATSRFSVPRISRTGSPVSRNEAKPCPLSFVSPSVVWAAIAPKRPARHQPHPHHHDTYEILACPLDSGSSRRPRACAPSLTPRLSETRICPHFPARETLARPATLRSLDSKNEGDPSSRRTGMSAIAAAYPSRKREGCCLTRAGADGNDIPARRSPARGCRFALKTHLELLKT